MSARGDARKRQQNTAPPEVLLARLEDNLELATLAARTHETGRVEMHLTIALDLARQLREVV